jgi:hypothetical protein
VTSEHPYIASLLRYQEVSNCHDIDACVSMFTDDGIIVMGGEIYQGVSALRDAHEYDAGSRTLVEFKDFEVEGDLVRCVFWNEHELGRVLKDGGITGRAEFTFRDGKICKFNILPLDEAERKRFMEIAASAFLWLRENHPEDVAKWKGFDLAAGDAVFRLAELWRGHLKEIS